MAILDRPPREWKRPAMPCKVKLQVVLNQGGRSAVDKEKLGKIEDVHFDHRPPVSERKFDTKAWDTIPPANDPAFIEAITVKQHDIRTNGPGGTKRITTRGSDTGNRAKDRAVIAKQAEHRQVMAEKGKPKTRDQKVMTRFKSRPMPKGRKFQSRKSA